MQNFILIDKIDYQFWPIIKTSDGFIRKGFYGEIIGSHTINKENSL
jgi:hypothetical protein